MHFFLGNRKLVKADEDSAAEGLEGLADAVDGGMSREDVGSAIKQYAVEDYKNLFDDNDDDIALGSFLTEAGVLVESASYNVTGYIPVSELDSCFVTATSDSSIYFGWRYVVFYDSEKTYLTGINSGVNSESSMKPTSFATPDSCAFVRITMRSNIDLSAIKVTSRVRQYVAESAGESRLAYKSKSLHPLYGKAILQFGDSINQGVVNNFGMADFLAERYNCTVTDYSMGGATMCGSESNNMQTQINSAISGNEDCDIVLFGGGANDISSSVALGAITATFDGGYDEDTFIGAFEEFCRKALLTWPDKTILYVRAHTMGSRDYDDQVTYGNAAISVCEKWGVPYVDMFKDSAMNTFLNSHRDLYTNSSSGTAGDMTHPNALGYRVKYTPLIENKLSLIMSGKVV